MKRSLEPHLVGARVKRVFVSRRDVIHAAKPIGTRGLNAALLQGDVITHLQRHGKNLAIVSKSGKVVCVHLGMSGHLQFLSRGENLKNATHVHCSWQIQKSSGTGQLVFRDPRRFGGLWLFKSTQELLQSRWMALGPDAIAIDTQVLFDRVRFRKRPIKSALLDQSIIAGVGNIYADEALFRAGIHPCSICASIPKARMGELCRAIREVMQGAIESGGTTIRTYQDGLGASGAFRQRLRVYGRGGLHCLTCGKRLSAQTVAQRTTVFCLKCQRKYR